MQHAKRFTNAVTKLYNAFHNGELMAGNPCACAVGNMCGGTSEWYRVVSPHFTSRFSSGNLQIKKTGYSLPEILTIERLFEESSYDYSPEDINDDTWEQLNAYGVDSVADFQTKESQFKGLCAVIEYLCELEGIANIMDYTKLFEFTDDNHPKNKLSLV